MVYELVDEGIGVVWSTAYLDEAERCATVLLLNQGQQLYFGPPKELTARAAGRSFLLENLGHGRRRVLSRVIKRPEVVDAVIQGASVRLVIAADSPVPDAAGLGAPHAVVVETAPRFEDAFVDLLGGGPKHESPLGQAPYEALVEGAAVVEAIGLTKQFGTFTAAKDISFRIPRGEIYGLLGPNGAGKSTTFKMMCGLLRPTAGHRPRGRLRLVSGRRGRPAAAGLHGPEVFALRRFERAAESRFLRRRVRTFARRGGGRRPRA